MAAVLKVNWGFHTQISQIHEDTVCTWRSRRPHYSNRDIRVWSWAFLWLCQSSKMHPVSKQTVVLQNTMCLVCGTFYIRILRRIVLFFAFFCVCVGGHRGFWEQRCTWMRNDEWCLFLHALVRLHNAKEGLPKANEAFTSQCLRLLLMYLFLSAFDCYTTIFFIIGMLYHEGIGPRI